MMLNVPHTAGSGLEKFSIYNTNYAVWLEIHHQWHFWGTDLAVLESSWLPSTSEECATGFKYTWMNKVEWAMKFFKLKSRNMCKMCLQTTDQKEKRRHRKNGKERPRSKEKKRKGNEIVEREPFPVLCAGCCQANCRTLSRPEQAGALHELWAAGGLPLG